MILSNIEIKQALQAKEIIIEPLPEEYQFETSALDLRMGERLYELISLEELTKEEPTGVYRKIEIDPAIIDTREFFQEYARPVQQQPDGSFILEPNKFVLGLTYEKITLPKTSKIAARVEGRSTLARLGLVVHLTAPTIHCGFSGHIVLEMYNFGYYPLILRPFELRVCQLIFERLGREPIGEIKSTYQHQKDIR